MIFATSRIKLPSIPERSFLARRIRQNPEYKFQPHYLYFLNNRYRWNNTDQIQKRILAEIPDDNAQAWNCWRQFRSAQSEITSIFLIENCLNGEVTGIEVSPPGVEKSCDIAARFTNQEVFFLEVKSQSGQQHGDKHPATDGPIEFTPQGEEDLRSWLFEERLSNKTGEPMTPLATQASEKGAHVLIAFTDIFHWETSNADSLAQYLAPDSRKISKQRNFWKKPCSLNIWYWIKCMTGLHQDYLDIHIYEAGSKTSERMKKLSEI